MSRIFELLRQGGCGGFNFFSLGTSVFALAVSALESLLISFCFLFFFFFFLPSLRAERQWALDLRARGKTACGVTYHNDSTSESNGSYLMCWFQDAAAEVVTPHGLHTIAKGFRPPCLRGFSFASSAASRCVTLTSSLPGARFRSVSAMRSAKATLRWRPDRQPNTIVGCNVGVPLALLAASRASCANWRKSSTCCTTLGHIVATSSF